MSYEIKPLPKELWPTAFAEIPDPPTQLYMAGTPLPTDHKYLTVIGTRKNSSYGKEVCNFLIKELSGLPVVIVSGLAFGIDSLAHKAALDYGLKTAAFPGSGLNEGVLYPRNHLPLAHQIIKSGGTLISELDPHTPAAPYTFPKRNRLMAALGDATLVIEANLKSGTLITARLALDYNKEVLTTPGSIFNLNTKGPHYLLQNGARLIQSGDDLRDALGFKPKEKKMVAIADLSPEELLIIDLINLEPKSKDEILDCLDLDSLIINATLSLLEIKGVIKERSGLIELA